MNRIFIAAASLVAFAGAAHAEGVSVQVAGKTPQAIHRDIHLAAVRVCDAELTGTFDRFYLQDTCITDAETRAQAQLGAAVATQNRTASTAGR